MATTAEYSLLSLRAYPDLRQEAVIPLPANWELLEERTDNFFGFSAGAYRNTATGEIVIAYSGSNEEYVRDLGASAMAGLGLPTLQVVNAMAFYSDIVELVRQQYPEDPTPDISFTGHSLGAGLASMMGVFFDRPATIFDPAPFEESVTDSFALRTYQLAYEAYQLSNGNRELDTAFEAYLEDPEDLFDAREDQVDSVYVDGEVLEILRTESNTIAGSELPINVGSSNLDSRRLHSMSLMAALQGAPTLSSTLQQIPFAVDLLLDPALYGDARVGSRAEFVRFLVRNHAAGNGLLTSFATDMQRLAGSGMAGNSPLTLGLVAALQDYYYWSNPPLQSGTFAEFVSSGTNSISFDLNAIPSGAEDLGRRRLIGSLRSIVTADEVDRVLRAAEAGQRWYVQAGTGALSLVASGTTDDVIIGGVQGDTLGGGDGNDLLIGYAGEDTLQGGAGADVLVGDIDGDTLEGGTGNDFLSGGAGIDTLDGGEGDDELSGGDDADTLISGGGRDTLEGGLGLDTYVVTDALGSSVVINDAGGGQIQVDAGGTPYTLGGGLEAVPGAAGYAEDQQGNRFSLVDGTLYVALANGGSLAIENFQDGQFGIEMPEAEPAETPDTPTGRVEYVGNDPNNFVDGQFTSPEVFEGTAANELIDMSMIPQLSPDSAVALGGFGDSHIIGTDFVDALIDDVYRDINDNTFLVGANVGNDVLLGGAGADVLETHGGDDQSYGGTGDDLIVDLPAALNAWSDTSWVDTSGNSNLDRLYGEAGNDVIVAGAGQALLDGGADNDELYGGAHDDRLLGGAGNDVLSGDTRLNGAAYEYALPLDVPVTQLFTGQYVEDLVAPGNDFLDGGAGDDRLLGGGGNDTLFGGANSDVLQGDTLFVPGGTRALTSNLCGPSSPPR